MRDTRRTWVVGVILLSGTLLGALAGCGQNPNHGINMEQARAAANRVHPPPDPSVKNMPGYGKPGFGG